MPKVPRDIADRVKNLWAMLPDVTVERAAGVIKAPAWAIEKELKLQKLGPFREGPAPAPTIPEPQPSAPSPASVPARTEYEPPKNPPIDPDPSAVADREQQVSAEKAAMDEIIKRTAGTARTLVGDHLTFGDWSSRAFEDYGRALGYNTPADFLQECISFYVRNRTIVTDTLIQLDQIKLHYAELDELVDRARERERVRSDLLDLVMQAQLMGAPMSGDQIYTLLQGLLGSVPSRPSGEVGVT